MSSVGGSDEPLSSTVRAWLESDEDGREILRLLVEDPGNGALKLLNRIEAGNAPARVSTAIQGGQVGTVLNIASVEALNYGGQAPRLSPNLVEKRLQLAWNLWIGLIVLYDAAPKQEEFGRVLETIVEINQVLGSDIAPPREGESPTAIIEQYAQRIATKDQASAAIFRIGGMLAAWWSLKGFHGQQVDDQLWSQLQSAIRELGFIIPGAPKRLNEVLQPLRPGRADQGGAILLLVESVARAIAGV